MKISLVSTVQYVVTESVRDVNEEIVVCAMRGDLSPETVRRLDAETEPSTRSDLAASADLSDLIALQGCR